MNIADIFYEIIIKFADSSELVVISLLGFVFINRKAFGVAIFLTVLTMALNAYLKSLWKVPLNPDLNIEGWAFPSGHTQSSAVFWFFLSLMMGKIWMIILIPFLMFGVISAIVYFGYHEWYEVLAALGFAGIEVILFYYILKLFDYYELDYYYLGFALSGIVLLVLLFCLPPAKHHYFWIWYGLGGMLGITLGWMLFDKLYQRYNIENKWIMLCLILLFGILLKYSASIKESAILVASIKSGMAAFIFSFVLPMLDKQMSKIKRLSR